MLVPITGFYAGVLTVILVVLGFHVGTARLRTNVSILHGEDMQLAERIRRHANFVENVPLALVLLAALELNGTSSLLLHALGAALVVARIAHPFGLHHDQMRHPLRFLGASVTTLVMTVAAIASIWSFVGA